MENPSILVIDADPKNLQILRDSLESSGFDVMTASDGVQALEIIAQDPPDIILSEVSLPDMDGFQLLEKLKESPDSAAIPIMFLTNRREIQDRVRSLRGGVKDYMIKPLHVKEVIARIRMILRRLQRVQNREGGETKKLAGRLEEHSVVDLIENFGVERKSGVLNVYNEYNRNGEIYFRDGAVVHASIGTLKAEKAVYQMLPWKSGHFIMTFKKVDVQDTISVSNLGLLLQGFKRMEERETLLSELPPPDTTFVLTDRFKQILRQKELSPDVAKLITLIDGRRDIMKIIDESIYDDLKTLKKLVRLYQQGFIAPGKASDSAAPEIKIRGTEQDSEGMSADAFADDDSAGMFKNFLDSPASDSITFANGSSDAEYESEFDHDDFPPLPTEESAAPPAPKAGEPVKTEPASTQQDDPEPAEQPAEPDPVPEVVENGVNQDVASSQFEEETGEFLLESPEMNALLTETPAAPERESTEPDLEALQNRQEELSREVLPEEKTLIPEPMASAELAPDLDILEALAKFQESEEPSEALQAYEAPEQPRPQQAESVPPVVESVSEPEEVEPDLPPPPSLQDAGAVQQSFVNPLEKSPEKPKRSPNTFGKKLEKNVQFTFPLRSYGRPGDRKETPEQAKEPKRPVKIPEITPRKEAPAADAPEVKPPKRIYDVPPAAAPLQPAKKADPPAGDKRSAFPDLEHLIPADETLRTPSARATKPPRDASAEKSILDGMAHIAAFADGAPAKLVVLGRNPEGLHSFITALSRPDSVTRLKTAAESYLGIGERQLASGEVVKVLGVSSDQQFTRLIDTLGAGFAGYVLLIEATTRENLDYFQYLYKALKTAYDRPFAVAVLKAADKKNLAPETIRDMIQAEEEDLIVYVDLDDPGSLGQFIHAFGRQEYLQRWQADA